MTTKQLEAQMAILQHRLAEAELNIGLLGERLADQEQCIMLLAERPIGPVCPGEGLGVGQRCPLHGTVAGKLGCHTALRLRNQQRLQEVQRGQ